MSELPPLELQCFGVPTARLAGGPAPPEVLRRKHLALLVYLALSPNRRRTRAHLVGVLWPETGDARARHSLNEAIRRLRAHVGESRLGSDGDSILLRDDALAVDALRFDALVERSPAAAARLVEGDFLEGFAVEGAPAFEEWVAQERDRYRARAAAALVAAGEEALAAARESDASASARRALALQPYAEPAVQLLMRSCALSGDSAGALAAFHEFVARLAALGEQPGRELAALADRIRGQRWRRHARPLNETGPPLVGQERAHGEAFRLVAEALQRGPQTLVITGDPGTGKTRLLTECVDRFALRGAVAAVATPLESDRDAPWSTLRTLLRAGPLRGRDAGARPARQRLVCEPGGSRSPGPSRLLRDEREPVSDRHHVAGAREDRGPARGGAHLAPSGRHHRGAAPDVGPEPGAPGGAGPGRGAGRGEPPGAARGEHRGARGGPGAHRRAHRSRARAHRAAARRARAPRPARLRRRALSLRRAAHRRSRARGAAVARRAARAAGACRGGLGFAPRPGIASVAGGADGANGTGCRRLRGSGGRRTSGARRIRPARGAPGTRRGGAHAATG